MDQLIPVGFDVVFDHILSNLSFMLLPALGYAMVATLVAIILGWGDILFHDTSGVKVLKLPGGGLLTGLPVAEFMLLTLWLSQPIHNQWEGYVGQFLTGVLILRLVLCALAHGLIFIGSRIASRQGLGFSVECMDRRCQHGRYSGNFLHFSACGGYTLLTAVGIAPLVVIAVVTGIPSGPEGALYFIAYMFPYPFVFAKLLVHNWPHAIGWLLKTATDILMFFSEVATFGWIVGWFTASVAALRAMIPGISPIVSGNGHTLSVEDLPIDAN